MRVFPDASRSYGGWAYDGESFMAYLDRSSRPVAARVRDLLEAWFERYPASNKAEILGRLRSRREGDQQGAFWELYLHEVFVRAGCKVSAASVGSSDPDFLVEGGERAYFVEASVAGPSIKEAKASQRKADLRNALHRAQIGPWCLNLRVDEVGLRPAPARYIRDQVEAILCPLGFATTDTEWKEIVVYAQDGWKVRVSAYPAPPSPGVGGAIVSEGPSELAEVRAHLALRREIHEKAGKFRGLEKPLIVAVNFAEAPLFSVDELVERALYGTSAINLTFSDDLTIDRKDHFRIKDGAWWDSKHRSAYDIWGVLVGPGVAPSSIKSTVPTIWSNPRVLRVPLPMSPAAPFGQRWVDDDGRMQKSSAGDVRDLLGLDESYPYTSTGE